MPDSCPTPQKLVFRSAAEARRNRRRLQLPSGVKFRLYPYECACGGWHLTRQTPDEQSRIRARIARKQQERTA